MIFSTPIWWWLFGILTIFTIGIVIYFKRRQKQKKAESKLSIFEHPSNFKKAPIEWVQKPKEKDQNSKTKDLTL